MKKNIKFTSTVLLAALILSAFPRAVCASETQDAGENDSVIEKTVLLTQSGTSNYSGSSICLDMKYDDQWLTSDCKAVYNYELAEFAVALSSNIYEGVSCLVDGKTITDDKTVLLSTFGFEDVTQYTLDGADYQYDVNDTSSFVIGHRHVSVENRDHEVFIVVVRGTNGTAEEWSSNFDVGNSDSSYTDRTGEHPEWTDPDNHKGFDVAANRIKEIVNDYVSQHSSDGAETDYLFTGHSRGAGIANILGAEFEADGFDSCAYTFASPNTTTNPDKYACKTVYNIVNENDFITTLPLSEWGFCRYGQDISADISQDETILTKVNDLLETNYSGADPDEMDQVFVQLADSRDMLYSDDNYQVTFDTYAGKEAAFLTVQTAVKDLGMEEFVSLEDQDTVNSDGKYYYEETLCTGAYMYGLSLLMSGTSDYMALLTNIGQLTLIFPADSIYSDGLNDLLSVFNDNLGATVYPHMTVCYYAIVDGLGGDDDYTHTIDYDTGKCQACEKQILSAEELAALKEADSQAPEEERGSDSSRGFRLWYLLLPLGIIAIGAGGVVIYRKRKGSP